MKVVLLMCISANGMTCHNDGSEDFLSWDGGKYVSTQAREFGNIIWGHTTYKQVVSEYVDTIEKGVDQVTKVILSKDPDAKLKPDWKLVNSPQAALDFLQQQGIQTALVDGGSHVSSAFLEANLIDEVHLIVEPVLVGTGKNLLAPIDLDKELQLISFEPIHKDELLLKYKVHKEKASHERRRTS